jgi:hypothetical protein
MMRATSAASASSRKAAKWTGRLRSAGRPGVLAELSFTNRARAMVTGDRAATARRQIQEAASRFSPAGEQASRWLVKLLRDSTLGLYAGAASPRPIKLVIGTEFVFRGRGWARISVRRIQ